MEDIFYAFVSNGKQIIEEELAFFIIDGLDSEFNPIVALTMNKLDSTSKSINLANIKLLL